MSSLLCKLCIQDACCISWVRTCVNVYQCCFFIVTGATCVQNVQARYIFIYVYYNTPSINLCLRSSGHCFYTFILWQNWYPYRWNKKNVKKWHIKFWKPDLLTIYLMLTYLDKCSTCLWPTLHQFFIFFFQVWKS
jgi:hypothetical protein